MGGAHKESRSRGSLGLPAILGIAGLVIALGAGGAVFAAVGTTSHHPVSQSARSTHPSVRTAAKVHPAPPPRPRPLRVVSISPAPGASAVGWRVAVKVRFSGTLASTTRLPSLTPRPQGSWDRVDARTLVFRPVGQFVPFSKEIVTVPAGMRSATGARLARPVTARFTVAGASTLRLQELLAELGYLPVSFAPSGSAHRVVTTAFTTPAPPAVPAPPAPAITGTTVIPAPAARATLDREPRNPADISLRALPGSFSWRFADIPKSLSSLWSAGQANVITTGAVMAFESAHGLGADGVAGPLVWGELLKEVAAHAVTTAPYSYVRVALRGQYVTIWQDGVNVFTTLANTGIAQAPTQAGTWPVYVRYTTTTMSGTEPNGQKYHDPGIPWVSYFHGGDALHGFLRAQYGFPQSLGCVEMPYSSAKTVFPYTPLGTLVTVA